VHGFVFFIFLDVGRLDLDNKLLQRPDVFGIVLALIYSIVKKHRLKMPRFSKASGSATD
jgi:hypothetical protein